MTDPLALRNFGTNWPIDGYSTPAASPQDSIKTSIEETRPSLSPPTPRGTSYYWNCLFGGATTPQKRHKEFLDLYNSCRPNSKFLQRLEESPPLEESKLWELVKRLPEYGSDRQAFESLTEPLVMQNGEKTIKQNEEETKTINPFIKRFARQGKLLSYAKFLKEKFPYHFESGGFKSLLGAADEHEKHAMAELLLETVRGCEGLMKEFPLFEIGHDKSLEIAEKILEKKYNFVDFVSCFDKFGFEDPEERLSLAEAYINKYLTKPEDPNDYPCWYFAENVDNFNIVDPASRFKIAEIVAKRKPEAFAKYFERFNIQNQDEIVSLVKIILKKDPSSFARHRNKFNIENPVSGVAFAKIVAERDFDFFTRHFGIFNINFRMFNTEDQKDIFSRAKTFAESYPRPFAGNAYTFDFEDPTLKVALAEIVAEREPEGFADYFRNFNIQNQKDRASLAEAFGKKHPKLLAEYFLRFDIKDQASIAHLANIVAERDPESFAENSHNFD